MKSYSTITNPQSLHHKKKLGAAYGGWAKELIEEGYVPYLVTFMFHHIPGGKVSRKAQMMGEVERVCKTLGTRCVRKPRSLYHQHQLPRFLVIPDFPVYKTEKDSIRNVTINDGMHIQGLAFQAHDSLLRTDLHWHFREKKHLYIMAGKPLRRLEAKPIDRTPEVATDYVMKSIYSGQSSLDDIWIFPDTAHRTRIG